MRVNSINFTPRNNAILNKNIAFSARVYMDYQKATEEIDKCPYSTQESIIGNINSLKGRLQDMPDDKIYVIDFNYQKKRESEFLPVQHYATISVKDEKGNSISHSFKLGQSGGSRKDDRTQLIGGQEIWQNGFKEITEKTLRGSFELQEDERINLKEEIARIADKIESRGKVHMNKATIAASILCATADCPDEIQESIIGNINTLTARLEEESAKEKSYELSIFNTGDCKSLDIHVKARKSTHWNEYQEIRLPISSTKYEEGSYKSYCNTDGEEIYHGTFKPLTEKLLWDAHHYLPFDKDKNYGKKQILDKLI